jgi:hypothetical protein
MFDMLHAFVARVPHELYAGGAGRRLLTEGGQSPPSAMLVSEHND